MELVVITEERQVAGEVLLLQALLEEGLDWLHIRKPGMPAKEVKRLIEQIPACWHPKIIVHDHAALMVYFDLGGLHVKLKDLGRVDIHRRMEVSTSAHGIQEFHAASLLATRIFISPLFNSISKPGYTADASLKALGTMKRSNKLVALGGVAAAHLTALSQWGFDAAAFLGYIWQSPDPLARFKEAAEINQKNATINVI